MRKARFPAPALQKDPVQGRKQPCLDFILVVQLMAFGCPDIKGLLGEVASVGLVSREAEGELVERLVMLLHEALKNHTSHMSAFLVRGTACRIVPEKIKIFSLEQTRRP